MGVNLAGVDIALNMIEKVEMLHRELNAVWQAIEERYGPEARKEIEKAIFTTSAETGDHFIKVKIERED
jgi:hypothetical protein